ncbi:hypothetical protein RRG08_055664 [Elysia crispata]|uniref:Uncharacterized protein n=1 Tax=Elysia crispata TaxID=231223 RepID=A0AAE0Z815_9GAST|nr:hypothetical protein RRG08_055664 [Elysia crispata]
MLSNKSQVICHLQHGLIDIEQDEVPYHLYSALLFTGSTADSFGAAQPDLHHQRSEKQICLDRNFSFQAPPGYHPCMAVLSCNVS